jgi:hypothetical protein
MTEKKINLLLYLQLDQLLTPQNGCLKHHMLATITHTPAAKVNLWKAATLIIHNSFSSYMNTTEKLLWC